MGLTQSQVATILDIGRDAVLRIENGERKIDAVELANFSKLYNVSINEIISLNDKTYTEIAYVRGFNKLSEQDQREIIELIEYKNMLKNKENTND